MAFTEEEIEHCKAAMSKPAPITALRAISDGLVVVSLTPDRRDLWIEWSGGKGFLAGGWPLYRAGMIDEFCRVTDAGRMALKQADQQVALGVVPVDGGEHE